MVRGAILAAAIGWVPAALADPAQEAGGGDPEVELARKAVDAIRAAGLDPAKEVEVMNVSQAAFSPAAQEALQKAGIFQEPASIALKAHPEMLAGGGAAPAPAGEAAPPSPPPPGGRKPARRGKAPPPPPSGGGGAPGHGAPDGFGRGAKEGAGPVRTVAANASAIAAAVKAGASVRVAGGDVETPFGAIRIGSDVTLDGGGATLWCPGNNHNGAGVIMQGNGAILRNIRIRNAGDGIDFGTSGTPPASNVLVENVTVSGSGDDGFSPSYKARDITIRWSAALGCTRAVFIKYGGTNVTIHHSIISHYWMRGPLVDGTGAVCDFRNNLVQHWQMWGSQPDEGAKGNFVNNVWRFDKSFDLGKADAALCTFGGQFHSAGNVYEGCSERPGASKTPVFEAPPVNELDDARTALARVLSDADGAGCMPRDEIDKAYLAVQVKWPAHPSDKGVTHGLQVPQTEARLRR